MLKNVETRGMEGVGEQTSSYTYYIKVDNYPYVEIVGTTSQKKTLSGNKTPKYGLWKRPNKLALVL